MTVNDDKLIQKHEADHGDVLLPGYMVARDAAAYLHVSERQLALFRQNGLIRWTKLSKKFLYRREWLDSFCEEWSCCDLSNQQKIDEAVELRRWKGKHDRGA